MFIGDFSKVFRKAAECASISASSDAPRTVWLKLDKKLYKSNLEFFKRTKDLIDKLEIVMDDPEHRLLVEEGQKIGFHLPEEKIYRDFVMSYKQKFQSFNPFHVRQDGENVWLAGDKAKAFIENREISEKLYELLNTGIFDKEYMPMIRWMNENGAGYSGPSIFQEIMDWQLESIRLVNAENEFFGPGRELNLLPHNFQAPQNKTKRHAAAMSEESEMLESLKILCPRTSPGPTDL